MSVIAKRGPPPEDDESDYISLARDKSRRHHRHKPAAKARAKHRATACEERMFGMDDLVVLNERTYSRVLCERRFMFTSFCLAVVCAFLFVVAMATAGWAVVNIEWGNNKTGVTHIGIWQEFVKNTTIGPNGEVEIVEKWVPHFPNPPKEVRRLLGVDLPHFYRTQAVFCVIAIALMIAGNACGLYSLRQHRYMFKRLAAGLYAFTAMCVLIVIEVMIWSINEWQIGIEKVQTRSQDEDEYLSERTTYGHSTIISWLVFAFYVLAAVVFIVGSRKRKGSRAATQEFEENDRPMELGR